MRTRRRRCHEQCSVEGCRVWASCDSFHEHEVGARKRGRRRGEYGCGGFGRVSETLCG